MRHSLRWVAFGLFAAAILVPAAGSASTSSVKIMNKSDWDIHHFYLSPVEQDKWGPDQLGDETVGQGGSFTLTDIPCASYDVKLVDEDGDECVVGDVDVCGSSQSWTITSDDLVDCEKATAENDDDDDK
jgi:hypothetical protein